MKVRNKRIYLILSFALLLHGTTFSFASNAEVQRFEEAMLVLKEREIIKSYEEHMDAGDTLTRAEACMFVVRCLGVSEEVRLNAMENPFLDVQEGWAWAKPYINYAAEHEIVKGRGGALFDPSAPVTAFEFITMLINALDGVDPEGIWPQNYVERAIELALIKNLPTELLQKNGNTSLTKGQAAVMLVNGFAQ